MCITVLIQVSKYLWTVPDACQVSDLVIDRPFAVTILPGKKPMLDYIKRID